MWPALWIAGERVRFGSEGFVFLGTIQTHRQTFLVTFPKRLGPFHETPAGLFFFFFFFFFLACNDAFMWFILLSNFLTCIPDLCPSQEDVPNPFSYKCFDSAPGKTSSCLASEGTRGLSSCSSVTTERPGLCPFPSIPSPPSGNHLTGYIILMVLNPKRLPPSPFLSAGSFPHGLQELMDAMTAPPALFPAPSTFDFRSRRTRPNP